MEGHSLCLRTVYRGEYLGLKKEYRNEGRVGEDLHILHTLISVISITEQGGWDGQSI
jgi:hypothetical protein